jgi:hypothetical protein
LYGLLDRQIRGKSRETAQQVFLRAQVLRPRRDK